MVLIRPDMNGERLETQLTISKMHAPESAKASAPGGGALEYFLGWYVPPGTLNWHPVLKKKILLKLILRS